ncbi:GDSL-type esterase/lipase family protein [Metabacillus malikii]|uniref:Lysophospholipase L1-like esterase n=1 Tax=Metabacillus malikii TaxID=1504265 RepID=A0ABT9ZJ95_9BACI|nr:GDSL-type esterase/lipase family protein [Metabacillus malikii]MDQ0231877.1 lysophospholipase L1-like esterase [Metabacillus malikii]
MRQYLNYLALGDSLTVGVGASFLAPGFVAQYKRITEHKIKKQVLTAIHAKSGIETGEVLKMIQCHELQEKIICANIITITAGGNDLIEASEEFVETGMQTEIAESVKESRQNLNEVMSTIQELKKNCAVPYIVFLLNLYNPLPKVPLADKWVRTINRQLNGFDNGSSVRVVDIYSAFDGRQAELLSRRDGIHPNDSGYRKIAETIAQIGYPKGFLEQ